MTTTVFIDRLKKGRRLANMCLTAMVIMIFGGWYLAGRIDSTRLVVASICLPPVMASTLIWWRDRKYELCCPFCRQSIVKLGEKVIATGKCYHCGEIVLNG